MEASLISNLSTQKISESKKQTSDLQALKSTSNKNIPKSKKKNLIKCPVDGCGGNNNKNKKLKSHRTIGGCPNFNKKSSTVFGRNNNNKTNVTKILENENISVSNLTLLLKTMEIKLRETQALLRRSENNLVFGLDKSEISTQTEESQPLSLQVEKSNLSKQTTSSKCDQLSAERDKAVNELRSVKDLNKR